MLLLLLLPMTYGYTNCDVRPFCRNATDSAKWWSSIFSSCGEVDSLHIPCNITQISPFTLENLPFRSLELDNCSLSTLRWQSVFTGGDQIIDISKCPLACSCDTSWVNGHFHHLNLRPPALFSCPHLECSPSSLERSNFTEPILGQSYSVQYSISGDIIPGFLDPKRRFFKWQMRQEPHRYKEFVSERSLRLEIDNITSEDLGVVRVVCWHCRQPLFATFEIRVPSPLKVDFEPTGATSGRLIVQGYPIDRLWLTVTDSQGEKTSVELSEKLVVLWNKLYIRPATVHSVFHRKEYAVFATSCTDCHIDDLAGEFEFSVCVDTSLIERVLSNSSEECQSASHHMNYVNVTVPEGKSQTPAKVDHRTTAVVVLFLLLSLLVIAVCYNKINKIKTIGWRKWRWSLNSRFSRRTSRATEETMLRLEERVSLSSSDYTGHVIPCIKGGAVQIHEQIGKGAFGAVYCGSWEKTGPRSVAVKALSEADAEVEKEAMVLCRLDHGNVVRLYGLTRDGDRLLLVFEMMRLGDLRSYLKKRAPQASNYAQFPAALDMAELKFIIREVAKGLCYLVAQQIVHRDLAARNCLVDGETDNLIGNPKQRPPVSVKISDFGMSRRLNYDSDYYRMQNQSLLPVRWLPPEAISEHLFSTKSDIWSLGVTMWEVFSYGSVPFDTLSNHEVVSYAIAGMRPPKPRGCPATVYELMEKCWALDPDQRISAEDVLLDPSLADSVVGPL